MAWSQPQPSVCGAAHRKERQTGQLMSGGGASSVISQAGRRGLRRLALGWSFSFRFFFFFAFCFAFCCFAPPPFVVLPALPLGLALPLPAPFSLLREAGFFLTFLLATFGTLLRRFFLGWAAGIRE